MEASCTKLCLPGMTNVRREEREGEYDIQYILHNYITKYSSKHLNTIKLQQNVITGLPGAKSEISGPNF